MNRLSSICVAIFLAASAVAEDCPMSPASSEKYGKTVLKDDNYILYTKTNGTHLYAIVCAKTPSWVGFGVSPDTGKMPNSDVALAWFENGVPRHISGYVGDVREKPKESQNLWLLKEGKDEGGWLRFSYVRPLEAPSTINTAKDFVLGANKIIWAFGDGGTADSYNDISAHAASTRGTRVLELAKQEKPGSGGGRQTCALTLPLVCLLAALTQGALGQR